jgi:hypothetical protein
VPKIKKVPLADGTKRYRFVIDLPRGRDEKRRQETHTLDRMKDAKAELARMTHQSGTGEYAGRWNGTVHELIDRYLLHAADDAEENTKASYRSALEPARERLGSMRARESTASTSSSSRTGCSRGAGAAAAHAGQGSRHGRCG